MAFPTGWNRACKVTCQHGQVTAAQTGFPGLVAYNIVGAETNLPQEMLVTGGANAARSDGGDIRFSSDLAGTQPLHAEVVIWTQDATIDANRKAEIWVKFNPSSATDTDIYVWYNNVTATAPAANDATFGSQGVWDSNYLAVWHMPNGAVLNRSDSTVTGNTLTLPGGAANPTAAAGKIDGGTNFVAGSSQFFGATSTPSFPTQITLEAWIKPTASGAGGQAVIGSWAGGTDNEWLIYTGQDTANRAYSFILAQSDGTTKSVAPATPTYTDGTWHHVVGTADGSFVRLYVDGVSVGTPSAYNNTIRTTGLAPLFVGKLGNNVYYWNGGMDEVRMSNIGRSSSWIATQYANTSSPSTFWAVGTPFTPAPPSTGTLEDHIAGGSQNTITIRDITIGDFN